MSMIDPDAMFRVIGRLTRWSMVGRLTGEVGTEAQAAWREFMLGYEPAMLKFVRFLLARMAGGTVHAQDAPDVVQEYLAACLEKGWLAQADPKKGRFRVWVRITLRRFTFKWVAHQRARRRSPEPGSLLSLDADDGIEVPDTPMADIEFDRTWAETIVDRALERIAAGNPVAAEVLRDLIRTAGEASPDIAERLGLSQRQYTDRRHRARLRLSALVAEEIYETAGDGKEALAEFDYLLRWLP